MTGTINRIPKPLPDNFARIQRIPIPEEPEIEERYITPRAERYDIGTLTLTAFGYLEALFTGTQLLAHQGAPIVNESLAIAGVGAGTLGLYLRRTNPYDVPHKIRISKEENEAVEP